MKVAGLAAAALAALLLGAAPWWAPRRKPLTAPWPPPSNTLEVPDGGFDLRYASQQVDLAYAIARHVVRVEAVHVPPPPYDPDNPRLEDGGGTVVAPGRLLTTAAYLAKADRIYAVLRNGKHLAVTVVRADPGAGLALLAFDPAKAPKLKPVAGIAPVPHPAPGAAAAIVVFPASLQGQNASLRIGAALEDGATLYLSGQALNGVPGFDTSGRLVAVALRMTPDRTRSLGIGGRAIAAWLKAGAKKKTGPRAGRGGRGP